MRAVVIRVAHAGDIAGGLQPIEEKNELSRPDVKKLRESGLIDSLVMRKLHEDRA